MIFVKDKESKTGKWCSVLVNVSVCLPTYRPIPNRHFHFWAFWGGFKTYEDIKWCNVISNLNQFGLIYQYHILISYVEITFELAV